MAGSTAVALCVIAPTMVRSGEKESLKHNQAHHASVQVRAADDVSLLDECDENAADGALLTACPRLHGELLLARAPRARTLCAPGGAAPARGSSLRPSARQARRDALSRRVQQWADRGGLPRWNLVRERHLPAPG